jgi:hypothetical protein
LVVVVVVAAAVVAAAVMGAVSGLSPLVDGRD